MFSRQELADIRSSEIALLAEVEKMCSCPGSYRYCCCAAGVIFLSHKPVGRVLRCIP